MTTESITEIIEEETQKPALIISVKRMNLRILGYDDLEHWLSASADHFYIGRSFIHYIKGTVGTLNKINLGLKSSPDILVMNLTNFYFHNKTKKKRQRNV